MAIRERLLKQLNIVRDGLNAMPPFHSRDLNTMRNALVQARDLCFQGLSENRFAEYKDTYDGLLLAIDQLGANASDEGEIVSLCSELLQYTITQTQKETTFKKEIFFLPYKASMWDSLESVWKAADEDKEHCIAYVMPIPYADLTPEHTVAEWHCERGLFPEYVPTMNWEDFDLQEIHPDVIFIHNPYDEYNAVTSVESRYYSSYLKECADKLVYIPYAVEEEVQSGYEAAETAIEHRVLLPAFLNADLIIAQSEDMRQAWINILMRRTNVKNRAYWEKRILGLGSPKIDKVLTSQKDDFDMPEKWKKLIQGKKVILYITSISATLQNSDKVCDKLRYVFDVFRHRDDAILWWRPHPLMKATFHSMLPQFEAEYISLEKQYIEEGWGIYDDSSDLHRAICWGDAYYGDYSSVLILFRLTRKYALLQTFGVTRKFKNINCTDLLDVGETCYLIARNGSLFELPHETNSIFYLGNIESKLGSVYFKLHLIHEKQLIYAQFCRGNLIKYDIAREGFSFLVECENDTKITRMPYNHMYSYKSKIFFFGGGDYASILIFDEITGEYTIDDRWIDQFEQIYGKTTTQYSPYDACRVEQYVWLTLSEPNMIMKYSMETGESEFYKINGRSNRFSTICYDDEDFWLSGEAEEVVCWNPKTEEIRRFSDFPKGFTGRIFRNAPWNDGKYLFNCSLKRENYLYFCPQRANMLIAINVITGEIIKIHDVTEETFCSPMVTLSNGNIFFQEKDFQWACIGEYTIDKNNDCRSSGFTSNKILKKRENHVLSQFMEECHADMLPLLIDEITSKNVTPGLQVNTEKIRERWRNFIRNEL